MKPPIIACSKCNGTGKIELPAPLLEVLTVMNDEPRKMWLVSEIHKLAPNYTSFGVTAINNRLEALRELGLVTREKFGKQWRYFIPKKG